MDDQSKANREPGIVTVQLGDIKTECKGGYEEEIKALNLRIDTLARRIVRLEDIARNGGCVPFGCER